MTVEAAVTGDRALARQAFALDPLAGRGDLRDTEAMVDELLAATARVAPPVRPVRPRIDGGRAMKLGFVGLGAMGLPMTRNLLAAGHQVTVASRSRGPVDAAVAFGATDGGTLADVAAASEVVILCVPNSPRWSRWWTPCSRPSVPGTIVVDCSTIDPDVERAQHERVAATGARLPRRPAVGRHGGRREGDAHGDGGRRRRHPRRGAGPPSIPWPGWSSTWAARAWARW